MISASTYTEAATAAVCTAGSVMTYAVRGRSSTLLAPSIYHGVRTRPAIALTFDDGPSESTPQLLEILGQYNTPSTFFQTDRPLSFCLYDLRHTFATRLAQAGVDFTGALTVSLSWLSPLLNKVRFAT